jgi:hypothetical protein
MARQHSPNRTGESSPFHIPGFLFRNNEDPMRSVNPLQNTLLQRVFIPVRKNNGKPQPKIPAPFRLRVNLRIILEAVLHFSRFWGHRDFWVNVRRLLVQFSEVTRPCHLGDIVNAYCTARDVCRNGHHRSIDAPNRIAELADRINSLRICDAEDIHDGHWKIAFSSWSSKSRQVFFDLGIHYRQFNDGTCAPELLEDYPDSRITSPGDASPRYESRNKSASGYATKPPPKGSASEGISIRGLSQKLNDVEVAFIKGSKTEDQHRAPQSAADKAFIKQDSEDPTSSLSLKRPHNDADNSSAPLAKRPALGVKKASPQKLHPKQPDSTVATQEYLPVDKGLPVISPGEGLKARSATAIKELETAPDASTGPILDLLYSLECRQARLEQIESSMRDWKQKLDQKASSDQAYIQKLETRVDELQDLIVHLEKEIAKSTSLDETVKAQGDQLGQQQTRIDDLKTIIESQKDDGNQLVINASNTKRLETIEAQIKTLQSQQSSDTDRINVMEAQVDGMDTKVGDLEAGLVTASDTVTKKTTDLEKTIKSMREAQDEESRFQKQKVEDLKRDLFENLTQDQNVSGYRFETVETNIKEFKDYKTRIESLEKDLERAKGRICKQAPLDRLELLEKDANQIVKELVSLEKKLEQAQSAQVQKPPIQLGAGNADIEMQICDLREYIDLSTTMYQKRMQTFQDQLNTMQQTQASPLPTQIDMATAVRLDALQGQLDRLQEQLDKSNGESRKQPLSPSVSDLDSVLVLGVPCDKASLEGTMGDLAKIQREMPAMLRSMEGSRALDNDKRFANAIGEAISVMRDALKDV